MAEMKTLTIIDNTHTSKTYTVTDPDAANIDDTIPSSDKTWSSKKISEEISDSGGGTAEGAVLYTAQALTPEQQAQARENIGAASADDIKETLGVTIMEDSSGNGWMSSHSADEIYYHVQNGGDVIVFDTVCLEYFVPVYIAYDVVHCYCHSSDSSTMLRYSIGEEGRVTCEYFRHVSKQQFEGLSNQVGDISTALDGIIAIQNELIGGDGV